MEVPAQHNKMSPQNSVVFISTHLEKLNAPPKLTVLAMAMVFVVFIVDVGAAAAAAATPPHCGFNCVKVTKMNHHKSEHIPMFISIMCHIRIANVRAKITQKINLSIYWLWGKVRRSRRR